MPWLSPIRVEEMTASRLVIVDPPYYLFGAVFLVLGLAVLIAGHVMKRDTGAGALNLRAVALAAPFLVVALLQLTSRSTIVFSRPAATMTLEQRYFGIRLNYRQVPLSAIEQADVALVDGNRSLYVSLRSGETVSLTGNSDRVGHNAAARAINSFLLAGLSH